MGMDPVTVGAGAKGAADLLGGGAAKGAGEAATAAGAGAGLAGASTDVLAPVLGATAAGAGAGLGAAAGDVSAGPLAAATGAGAADTALNPISGDFQAINQGITSGTVQPVGANFPPGMGVGASPAGTGATGVAAPAGVSSPLGVDPTAIAGANAPSPLDTAAFPFGPNGAPGTAGPATAFAPTGAGTAPAGSIADLVQGPTAAGAGGAAAPSGVSGSLQSLASSLSPSNLISGAAKSISANPLGVLAGVGGLGYSMIEGQKMSAAQKQLQEQASSLNAQGQQLASYLLNGNLPPGLKASLDQATAAAKAKVISNFAGQGLSTDPTQNTALAQELAMIDQQSIISTAQIGQQLLGSGIQESGMASGLYTTLANLDQTQTAQIGQAIANFAAALSPKPTLSVNLGKA